VFNNMLRAAAVVPVVTPAAPLKNLIGIFSALTQCERQNPDIVVLPELCLTGVSCGALFRQRLLLDPAVEALEKVAAYTEGKRYLLALGLPVQIGGLVLNATALLRRGRVLGLVPALSPDAPFDPVPGNYRGVVRLCGEDVVAAPDLLFKAEGAGIGIVTGAGMHRSPEVILPFLHKGASVILNPASAAAFPGRLAGLRRDLLSMSRIWGCGIAVSMPGAGEAVGEHLYRGYSALYECGECLSEAEQASPSPVSSVADFDLDIISARRRVYGLRKDDFISVDTGIAPDQKESPLRPISRVPFLRTENVSAELNELFELQTLALAEKLRALGVKSMALDLSDNVSSLLALFVCVTAADRLKIPRGNILALAVHAAGQPLVPGLSKLCDALGCELKEMAFETKGITGDQGETERELTLSRLRCQALQKLADSRGAISVGSVDLSDAALGWCPFAGDSQLCYFNVNHSVAKTVASLLVEHLKNRFGPLAEDAITLLTGSLSEKETVPGSRDSRLAEKTLGPYRIHDFFLFYTLYYRLPPEKIKAYACAAFEREYEPSVIERCYYVFINRYLSGQFKRRFAAEGVNLAGMPLLEPFPSGLDAEGLSLS